MTGDNDQHGYHRDQAQPEDVAENRNSRFGFLDNLLPVALRLPDPEYLQEGPVLFRTVSRPSDNEDLLA